MMMIQVGRTPLIQAGWAITVTLQPDVLASLPKRSQVLAVAVLNTIIEQVDHLLDVVEIPGKPGRLDSLIPRPCLCELECRGVVKFDGLDESLDLEGNVRLG
ncbi:hypothetical protein D9M70_569940 [compost metagenome]